MQPRAFTSVPSVVNYLKLIQTLLANFEVAGVDFMETIGFKGHCIVDLLDIEVEEQVVEEFMQHFDPFFQSNHGRVFH